MWINIPSSQPLDIIRLFFAKPSYILCFSTSCIQYVDKPAGKDRVCRRYTGWSVLVLLLLVPFLAGVSHAETFPFPYISPELDRTILMAESMVMDRRYREVREVFDRMEQHDPDSLLPSMGRLLSLMVQSLEKGAPKDLLEKEFAAEFPKNRALLKKVERRGGLNAWDHFLLGGSLGVRGLYELEHRRYLAAFMHGMRALSHIHVAARLDPEIHDLAFATGMYKYYRSVKTRYLWFLPFVGDQREEGLAEIRQALQEGHYAVPAAKIALVMLSEREGRDVEGIRLGRRYLREYPNCKLIRDALEAMEQRYPAHAGRIRSVVTR